MYFRKLFFLISVCAVGSRIVLSSPSKELLLEKNERILREHNSFRQMHKVPDLVLNQTIREFAQKYAEELAEKNEFRHHPGIKYGENLWKSSGDVNNLMVQKGMNPVQSWYDEKSNYPDGKFEEYGHFTQVIWKTTEQLGCGIGVSKEPAVVVVCNYYPPGNLQGAFDTNVPPTDTDNLRKKKIPVHVYIVVITIVVSIIALLIVLIYAR